MNTFYKILLTAIAVASVMSCAKETDESDESVQRRILEAYVETHYPDATQSASGLYLVDSIPGTGRTPDESDYVLVDYIISYLDGTYDSYSGDSLARQLGTYSYSGYYHPRIWRMSDCTSGIIELLTGMKEGGMVKAIIPATLLDEESGSEIVQGDGSSKIYELYLREVIDDAYTYQTSMLSEYGASSFYPPMDSTEYGFYFRKYLNYRDTIDSGDKANVRYVGKFLDGTVFDTNIADTAKKHRIYSSDNEYAALSFTYNTSEDETINANTLVEGFTKALWRMGYRDHAITFFYSNLGYGDNGSGDIPGYVPLIFELWIEEPEED